MSTNGAKSSQTAITRSEENEFRFFEECGFNKVDTEHYFEITLAISDKNFTLAQNLMTKYGLTDRSRLKQFKATFDEFKHLREEQRRKQLETVITLQQNFETQTAEIRKNYSSLMAQKAAVDGRIQALQAEDDALTEHYAAKIAAKFTEIPSPLPPLKPAAAAKPTPRVEVYRLPDDIEASIAQQTEELARLRLETESKISHPPAKAANASSSAQSTSIQTSRKQATASVATAATHQIPPTRGVSSASSSASEMGAVSRPMPVPAAVSKGLPQRLAPPPVPGVKIQLPPLPSTSPLKPKAPAAAKPSAVTASARAAAATVTASSGTSSSATHVILVSPPPRAFLVQAQVKPAASKPAAAPSRALPQLPATCHTMTSSSRTPAISVPGPGGSRPSYK